MSLTPFDQSKIRTVSPRLIGKVLQRPPTLTAEFCNERAHRTGKASRSFLGWVLTRCHWHDISSYETRTLPLGDYSLLRQSHERRSQQWAN